MTTPDLHHLAAAYALDALTPIERQAFEAHQPSCEICTREVAEFRETAAILGQDAAVSPPPELKAQIVAAASKTAQLAPILPEQITDLADRRRNRKPRNIMLTAAAAVLIVLLGAATMLRPAPEQEDIWGVLAAPDAVVLSLDGATGTVRVVWSPQRSELAVVGQGLDDPGPDKTYELWFLLEDGAVAPAGLFKPDDSGTIETILAVEQTDGIGFGVTIEPATGSPQPTTDVLYVGTL